MIFRLRGRCSLLFFFLSRFKAGQFDLRLWEGVEADGSEETTTPSKVMVTDEKSKPDMFDSEPCEDILLRLGKLRNEYEDGRLPNVEWLDRLSLAAVAHRTTRAKENLNFRFLNIEFPRFKSGDTYYDIVYDSSVLSPMQHPLLVSTTNSGNLLASSGASSVKTLQTSDSTATGLSAASLNRDSTATNVQMSQQLEISKPFAIDPDLMQENLIELKHRRLVRSYRATSMDADLKPNSETRDALYRIIGYPPGTKLSSNDKDLVWQYRFYLSKQKKALTKFLSSVNWSSRTESGQALDMLSRWVPIDVEDSLELLSPAFSHPTVRRYAVSRLSDLSDDDLLLYLLQLVQALRYEDIQDLKNAGAAVPKSGSQSYGVNVVESINEEPATPATEDDDEPPRFMPVSEKAAMSLRNQTSTNSPHLHQSSLNHSQHQLDLASFLIQRACSNIAVATYLYWYLAVEKQDVESQQSNRMMSPPVSKNDNVAPNRWPVDSASHATAKSHHHYEDIFTIMLERLSYSLKQDPTRRSIRQQLSAQKTLVNMISDVVKEVHAETSYREKKVELLQQRLTAPEYVSFNTGEIVLPLDPSVRVCGIEPASANLFKSKLMPSKLTFVTTPPQDRYVVIFKDGDDLRQDQLVQQIIQLMDRLLRRENLDLRLTPYKVLATKPKQGFVQYIPAIPVREILATENTLMNFMRKHNPCEHGPYGIAPDVMDNYIRSCAGYCIITYILGVGDRHHDNLLLTHTGKLFHIDFGYLLGRDPKPLPPPMKLSREMVDAMGGTGSEHFKQFRQLCYTVFLTLRRSTNLLSNLLALMIDANIPDIALEPDKAVRKVAAKFRPELNDEEAVRYLQNLIDDSLSGIVAGVVEAMHTFVQYWKN